MKELILRSAFFVSVTIALTSAASAVTYTAKLLGPIGFQDTSSLGIAGGHQVGLGYGPATTFADHATMWSGTAESYVDLHPAGFVRSVAYGISGNSQTGIGYNYLGPNEIRHALVWHGSAASAVDLNGSFQFTAAYAVDGTHQVGEGSGASTQGFTHALMWSGSAASVVDLHPPTLNVSTARDVFETFQGGWGSGPPTNYNFHALLWNGTAASVVDLHRAAFEESALSGISADSQVGIAANPSTGNIIHAALWHGTAASMIDLLPTGFDQASALAVSGNIQVGSGTGAATGFKGHALAWNGTASSVIDLHSAVAALDPTLHTSNAFDVDSFGNIVGSALGDDVTYAVLWTPIPEPTSCALVMSGTFIASLLCSRRWLSGRARIATVVGKD